MGRRRRKADLVIHRKDTSAKGLIREVVIWRVGKSIRYPEGIRYRLVLVAPKENVTLLLLDNHWPKGHHVHRGKNELNYHFISVKRLIADFRKWGDDEERKYESKKDSD